MEPDATWRPRLASRARLKFDAVANQEMLLFPEAALLLNETGAAIVRLCDGARSIDQIVDAAGEEFRGADRDELRREVRTSSPRFARADCSNERRAAPIHARRRAHLSMSAAMRLLQQSDRLPTLAHELSTAEWRRAFSEAAELGVVQLHLSGGEPMLRDDLVELIRHARACDLYTNLITGGTLLDEDKLRRFRDAGLEHIQLSIQGASTRNRRDGCRSAIASQETRGRASYHQTRVSVHAQRRDSSAEHRRGSRTDSRSRTNSERSASNWRTRSSMRGAPRIVAR